MKTLWFALAAGATLSAWGSGREEGDACEPDVDCPDGLECQAEEDGEHDEVDEERGVPTEHEDDS